MMDSLEELSSGWRNLGDGWNFFKYPLTATLSAPVRKGYSLWQPFLPYLCLLSLFRPRPLTTFLFFAPIPCSYTCGAARNYFSSFLSARICKIMQFILYGSIYCSYILCPRRKTIWSELESNQGPLASQVTALTTRPCLVGQAFDYIYFWITVRGCPILTQCRGHQCYSSLSRTEWPTIWNLMYFDQLINDNYEHTKENITLIVCQCRHL